MHRSRLSLLVTLVAGGLLIASPAAAHISVNPDVVGPDGYSTFSLQVPHGCGDSPTTALSVQIPGEMLSVTPEQVPGWTVSTDIGELDEPYEDHGEEVTEGVVGVTWTVDDAEALPTDQYRDFGMSVQMADVEEGPIYLPTIQECEDGEHAWVEIPSGDESWSDLDEPAPYVEVMAVDTDADSVEEQPATDDADEAAEQAADDVGEQPDEEAQAAGTESAAADGPPALVAWLALALGALGLVVGGAAFAAARR